MNFILEQMDQKDETEQNNHSNGTEKKQKPRFSPSHVASNAIPEEGRMPRSQSVGHSMTSRKISTKTRPDELRCMLSQPLLNGRIETVYENQPLSRKRSSATLSRPDIFYQVNHK